MQRGRLRNLSEDGTGAAAYFQYMTGLLQPCLLEYICSQITSPLGLLEITPMPIHSPRLKCKFVSIRRARDCPVLYLNNPVWAVRRRQAPHKARLSRHPL